MPSFKGCYYDKRDSADYRNPAFEGNRGYILAGGIFPECIGAYSGILHLSHRGILQRRIIYIGYVNVYRRFSGIDRRRYQDQYLFRPACLCEKPYDKKALWGVSPEYTGRRDFQGLYDCISVPAGGVRRNITALHIGTGI